MWTFSEADFLELELLNPVRKEMRFVWLSGSCQTSLISFSGRVPRQGAWLLPSSGLRKLYASCEAEEPSGHGCYGEC